MSVPLSPTRLFSCPDCHSTLPYDVRLAGKKCRCGKCGKVFNVPKPGEFEQPSEQSRTKPAAAPHVEFWCRVCDTRLVARSTDAGRKMKCPDCHALNLVPTPKTPEPRREPPAMHGQQYGVWKVNQAPASEDLRAKQPRLFPVYCRVCDTLMYAQPKHIGESLKCPDCGALTTVKEPPPPEVKKSPLVPAGQEYQLDPAVVQAARPVREDLQRLQEKSRLEAEEAARKRAIERPKMPAWPTFQGVASMLSHDPLPTWWVGLSASGIVMAWLLASSFVGQGAGGLGLVFAMMCRIFGLMAFILWFGPMSAIACAVVAESSDGLAKLHSRPSIFFINCLLEMSFVGLALALSLIPAFALLQVGAWEVGIATGSGALLLIFPVLLLSAFQENTPLGVFSPRVWGSLFRRPLHWFLFFAQSTVVAGLVAVTVGLLGQNYPEWIYAGVPLALAGMLVYFRILGRFAWWLAESLADPNPLTGKDAEDNR